MVKDALIQHQALLLVQNAIVIATYLIYIVIRRKLSNKTNRLYEFIVILTLATIVVISSLVNARVLPERLTGVNPLSTSSINQYRELFTIYAQFALPKITSFALFYGPLYLAGDYFYLKNDENFYREIFANQKYSKYKDFS